MGSKRSAPHRSRRASCARVVVVASVLVLGACASDATVPQPNAARAASAKKAPAVGFGLPRVWPKSRLLPDVDPGKHDEAETADGSLRLWGRMRVRTRAGGTIERAPDLLPVGRVSSIELPERLGGGFVFVSATGRGTELWRAPSWLEPLVPLTTVGPAADMERPLVAGFDRLYLRLRSGELLALDPKSGATIGFGPLPVAPAHADMVFVDGWRGVVDTDLRGPLATFDAGQTWRPIPLSSRVRSVSVSEEPGAAQPGVVLFVDGGYHVLSATGDLAYFPGFPDSGRAAVPPTGFATPPGARRIPAVLTPAQEAGPKPGPLGRRPLRVALERGYPETEKTAVVAHEGTLARVSLENGAVIEAHESAYPEPHAGCSGIALAGQDASSKDIGFVCGSPEGPTTVYALAWPRLRPVLRFEHPRVVLESGQGALVVRGPCSDEDVPDDVRPFCVRLVDGTTKEVRVRGEVGAERVVALADGRVAIVVPPRPGTQGQLSILQGSASKHLPLRIPDGAPREIETGMWLDGMQQTAPDEIGGWVEAGGPTFGVRIKLDGAVSVGPVVNEPSGVLVAGRFGLGVGADGKLLETTDMGKSWAEAPVPQAPDADGIVSPRRCGPVGCAIQGWLRVGWGEPASPNDLREVAQPEAPKLSSYKLSGAPVGLTCSAPRAAADKKPAARTMSGEASTGWLSFQGVAPPALEKDEVGFDGGDPYGAWPFRAYVWGKRDSDWSRTGRFVVRFEDEFALDSIRSSAPSASPWSGEDLARDVFGAGSWGVTWGAFRDPAGRASLVSICRGRACSVLAVEDRQPVLPLTTTDPNGLPRPLPQSAVQVGPTWFYLGDDGAPDRLALFRADLGRVRRVASLPRPLGRSGTTAVPRLVRRAKGNALGLLFLAKEGPFDRRGTRYVIEIDPETGALAEPLSLGRPDLGDLTLSAPCDPAQDGWLVELPSADVSADATVGGSRFSLEGFELRARMSPGAACLEAASAVTSSTVEKGSKGGQEGASGGLPVFLTSRSGGGRSVLDCRLTVAGRR